MKFVSVVDVEATQQQADSLAKAHRELDARIQAMNWLTDYKIKQMVAILLKVNGKFNRSKIGLAAAGRGWWVRSPRLHSVCKEWSQAYRVLLQFDIRPWSRKNSEGWVRGLF